MRNDHDDDQLHGQDPGHIKSLINYDTMTGYDRRT